MVAPKLIGKNKPGLELSAEHRRFDGLAIVPGKNEIRKMEMFNAVPALNKREEIITEKNSTFRFLRFARIYLDSNGEGYHPVTVKLANEEVVLYVNRGKALVLAANELYTLSAGDAIYAGTDEAVVISTDEFCDVSEFRATDCNTHFPVQLVKHKDIEGTPLAADVGSKRPMTRRTVYKLIDGSNIKACRLLFGDTFMAQHGAVGSYPPHFHGPDGPFGLGKDAKEEIYHFRVASDIPDDTGYVLQNCSVPGEAVGSYVHIFDEQAINVTHGYHDTLAPPSMEFMFTWCLASFTEQYRDWSQVVNKPGYDGEW